VVVSASLLAILQGAERMTERDMAVCRRGYRKTGMSEAQVAWYGARCAWPDACQLVRLNGAGPYR
jgi:hypothetical protein